MLVKSEDLLIDENIVFVVLRIGSDCGLFELYILLWLDWVVFYKCVSVVLWWYGIFVVYVWDCLLSFGVF